MKTGIIDATQNWLIGNKIGTDCGAEIAGQHDRASSYGADTKSRLISGLSKHHFETLGKESRLGVIWRIC
jgi:hypothetical protein